MNYYAARARQSDGRFDFTCRNDDLTWPVGYCRAHKVWSAADFKGLYSDDAQRDQEAEKLNAKYGPLAEKFHSSGHATAAEACACYRQYLLDTQLEFSKQPNPDEQKRCAAILETRASTAEDAELAGAGTRTCGKWTQHAGWVEHQLWPLCPEHQTREVVEKLFPSIGSITSSY